MANKTDWVCDRCGKHTETDFPTAPNNWSIFATIRPPLKGQKSFDLCFSCLKSWFDWFDGTDSPKARLAQELVDAQSV